MLWPQAVTPVVTVFGAYHHPPEGNFFLLQGWGKQGWCATIILPGRDPEVPLPPLQWRAYHQHGSVGLQHRGDKMMTSLIMDIDQHLIPGTSSTYPRSEPSLSTTFSALELFSISSGDFFFFFILMINIPKTKCSGSRWNTFSEVNFYCSPLFHAKSFCCLNFW